MNRIYLIFYYLFLQYLPMQPIPGYKISYWIRYIACKRILLECGSKVVIKNKCYFGNGSKLKVGSYSQLGQNSRLGGPIEIGEYVMMGPDVVIMGVTHDVSSIEINMVDASNPSIEKPVFIGNNVWLGTRVIILPGVTIGNNCIIGAGAVVTKSFGDDLIIGGVPAKIIGSRSK